MNFIKNKIFILSGVVSVFVLGVSFLLITYFFVSNKKVDMTIDSIKAEENFLKEANKNSIKDLSQSFVKKVEPIEESDHYQGDLKAPVQLVFYGDFTCPFSLSFYKTLSGIRQEFGNDLVFAYRHYPSRGNLMAKQAAIASECASAQGKFWVIYDKLFEDSSLSRLSLDQIKADSNAIGLDLSKFLACLESEESTNEVKKDIVAANDLGVLGTPAIFVNGESLPGAYPMDDFIDPRGERREGLRKIISGYLKK